jgi:hypothetical protein
MGCAMTCTQCGTFAVVFHPGPEEFIMSNCKTLTFLGAALLAACLVPSVASAQLRDTLLDPKGRSFESVPAPCIGKVRLVDDVTFEGVQVNSWNYPNGPTGFAPVPVLSKQVALTAGCINAHLSAMVGSAQTYGMSKITLFQVRITPASTGTPVVMDGHYPTCYGIGPCVALSSEYDVDMLGANFYKAVAPGTTLPPGPALVEVLWTGGPAFLGSAGAIGAAFVLKIYHQ